MCFNIVHYRLNFDPIEIQLINLCIQTTSVAVYVIAVMQFITQNSMYYLHVLHYNMYKVAFTCIITLP